MAPLKKVEMIHMRGKNVNKILFAYYKYFVTQIEMLF